MKQKPGQSPDKTRDCQLALEWPDHTRSKNRQSERKNRLPVTPSNRFQHAGAAPLGEKFRTRPPLITRRRTSSGHLAVDSFRPSVAKRNTGRAGALKRKTLPGIRGRVNEPFMMIISSSFDLQNNLARCSISMCRAAVKANSPATG